MQESLRVVPPLRLALQLLPLLQALLLAQEVQLPALQQGWLSLLMPVLQLLLLALVPPLGVPPALLLLPARRVQQPRQQEHQQALRPQQSRLQSQQGLLGHRSALSALSALPQQEARQLLRLLGEPLGLLPRQFLPPHPARHLSRGEGRWPWERRCPEGFPSAGHQAARRRLVCAVK